MARTPYHTISTRTTPQGQPIPGTVPNSGGGFSFPVDNWARLQRFLILGSEGGTYYTGEKALTKQNADALFACIKEDGPRVVRTVVEISIGGRNPKQQPIMFALAACAGAEDEITRGLALDALPQVCRTGSHLFMFAGYVEQFRGWGRGLRTAVGGWYLNPHIVTDPEDETATKIATDAHPRWLAFQLAKYKQREGWSHRDLLRLSKPRPERDSELDHVLGWATGKYTPEEDTYLGRVDLLMKATTTKEALALIKSDRFSWEMVPSELLAKPEVWKALIPNLGIGALVRNLGRMTANGTIGPMSEQEKAIVAKLTDLDAVKGSRIHPLNVLTAASTYAAGRGMKGSLTWQPNTKVFGALNDTFQMAFVNVEPANKRTLVCLDVSGSMDGSRIANTFLSAREAACAMALVTVSTEPDVGVMAFSGGFIPVALHAGMSLAQVVETTRRMPFDSTNCALPMEWALKHGVQVDSFVIYTDSETNTGRQHPMQALRKYREATGIPAKLIVVAMTSNGFSIADPKDTGSLDVVGFDSAAPALIADFSAGRI